MESINWFTVVKNCSDLIESVKLAELSKSSGFSVVTEDEDNEIHSDQLKPSLNVKTRDLSDIYLSSYSYEASSESVVALILEYIKKCGIVVNIDSDHDWKMREYVIKGIQSAILQRCDALKVENVDLSGNSLFLWKTSPQAPKRSLTNQAMQFAVATSISVSIGSVLGIPVSNRWISMEYICNSLIQMFRLSISQSMYER